MTAGPLTTTAAAPPAATQRLSRAVQKSLSQSLVVPPMAAWAVAIAVFLSISRLHQHIQIMGRLRFPMLFSALAIVLMLLSAHKWRPADLKKHFIPKIVGLMLFIAVAGLPFSLAAGRSFWFLFENWGRTLAMAIMVWAVARTPKGQLFVARLFFLSGFVAVALALRVGRLDSDGRLSGGYTYDPNDLAVVALMTLPFGAWMILQKGAWKILGMISVPMILFTAVKSGSRGGFIALCFVVLGFAWLMMAPGGKRLRKIGVGAIAVIIISLPLLPPSYYERIASLFDDTDYNQTSQTGRKEVWKRGMGYAFTHPLVGVGIANFDLAEGFLSNVSKARAAAGVGFKWGVAHNMYVEVSAELGLIAGVAFVILIWGSIYVLLFKRPPPGGGEVVDSGLQRFVGISILALASGGFFLSLSYYDIVYVCLALGCALRIAPVGGVEAGAASTAPRRAVAGRHPVRGVQAPRGQFRGRRP